MTPAEPDPPEISSTPEPSRLPSWVRPTWELELLISGAVIFSLFQLPPLLGSIYFEVEHHLSSRLFVVPFFLYYGAMLCVIVLIIGFAVHFLARGYWVALCGLNSVFPNGVRWQDLRIGPLQRTYYRSRTPSAKTLERRADRFASTVFSILFYMLFTLAVISGYLVLALVVIGALLRWLAPEVPQLAVFYGLLLLFLGPILLVGVFDGYYRKRPERLRARPRLRRFLLAVLHRWQRLILHPLYGAIPLTFQSNFSTRKVNFAFMASSFVLAAIFIGAFMIQTRIFGYDSYEFFPESAELLVVDADFYETLRSPASRARVPTIPSDVLEGPYARLFVPYRPNRDHELLTAVCPALDPLRSEGLFLRSSLTRSVEEAGAEGLREILDCFDRIWRVSLNGEPVEPRWAFHRHPIRRTAGLLAQLPLEDLGAGRHELIVEKGPEPPRPPPQAPPQPPPPANAQAPTAEDGSTDPPAAGSPAGGDPPAPSTEVRHRSDDLTRRYVIPFWR